MTHFEVPTSVKSVRVLGLSESARKAEILSRFDKPIEERDLVFLAGNGLQDACHRASSCMGWIWRQWLLGVPARALSKRVESFVERGLEFRERSRSYDYLPLHDLYLMHCAVFASGDAQLRTVAERVADASGDKGKQPLDNGELYAAAWCGMVKYWILGDCEKAVQQFDLIWGAYREKAVLATPKPLVVLWLRRDWGAFRKQQQKDFEKLWNRARKDGWTVKSENSTEIVVTTERYQIEHQWCWAHCGLAALAHRQGAEVMTDSFWFPAAAIDDTSTKQRRSRDDAPDQMRMF